MSGPYRRVVIFVLRHARIMQFEIREIWCCVTGQAISDLAGSQLRRRRGNCRGFCKKYFEAGQLLGSKDEWLRVKLELPICSVRVQRKKSERSSQFPRFHE
jgi:hypothetical protein